MEDADSIALPEILLGTVTYKEGEIWLFSLRHSKHDSRRLVKIIKSEYVSCIIYNPYNVSILNVCSGEA
jgi:hypothetical protein